MSSGKCAKVRGPGRTNRLRTTAGSLVVWFVGSVLIVRGFRAVPQLWCYDSPREALLMR